MIKVTVKMYSLLQSEAGESEIEVCIKERIRLEELLEKLCDKYGRKFKNILYNNKGRLNMLCLINGKKAELEETLKDGDIVVLMFPAGGG